MFRAILVLVSLSKTYDIMLSYTVTSSPKQDLGSNEHS